MYLPHVCLVVSIIFGYVNGAKILGLFPAPARSHFILGNALMKGLAERGHDVTIISPYSEKTVPKNGTYREIVLDGVHDEFHKTLKELNLFNLGEGNNFFFLLFISRMVVKATDDFLGNAKVQSLINSKEHFDVVIAEQFLTDAEKGIAAHFNAPLISIHTLGANSWVNHVVGNPAPLSYVPEFMSGFSNHMTFLERLYNTIFNFYTQTLLQLYIIPQNAQIYKKYFPNGPDFYDVMYNSSILFLNSHPSTNEPVPHVPNMIEIGGFHVQPSKKLPDDLQNFLDNAKDGVIYFSMGSNLRSAHFPLDKREAFLKTFSKLKEKVLWKWEDDELPGQPSNVKLGKWLPQQDILAHPNVKLFITHGGLLSTAETIYHGVPVLAIPIAADQKLNAKVINSLEFGLTLFYQDISEEMLTKKIRELLVNEKYSRKAKERSKLFHDRPVKPLDLATYWVEYVIRHGGAQHLRVAALDLPWYQYHLLDVIAFMVFIISATVFVLYLGIKKLLLSRISRKNQKLKKN